MARTWILVAESSRAKLYFAESRKSPLVEIEDFIHPESRLHERELVTDKQGRHGDDAGKGRHGVEQKISPRRTEQEAFARTLAQRLEAGYNEKAFDRLVLVAPPAFLGLLRDTLSDEVLQHVTEEIDKHLVQQPAHVVREHLSMSAR